MYNAIHLLAINGKNGLPCCISFTKSSGWECGKAGCDSFQMSFLK